jgi:hypothetical protein
MDLAEQPVPTTDGPLSTGGLPARLYRAALSRWNARSERFRRTVVFLFLLGGLSAWLLPLSTKRLIDGDEGYLLMAARLISEGRWPYRDFFLTQTPILPAVYGAFFWGMGRSWLHARILAGLIAVAMGLLVYGEARSATRRRSAAFFATGLFAFSGSTIGWLTIVKGYGLSALLMLFSTFLIGRVVRRAAVQSSVSHPFLVTATAGLAIGLAASTRLYTIVVMPTLALYLVGKLGLNRTVARRLASYGLGCVVGLLPSIVCYVLAGRAFLFDTFFYHGIREYGQNSLFGTAEEKLPSILKTVGLDADASYGERQWMGMAILAILALLLRIRARNVAGSAAFWVALALAGASLLPNPFLPQYLCLPIPFLAVEGGRLVGSLLDAGWGPKLRRWPAAVAVAAVGYLGYHGWVADYEHGRFLHTGVSVPGVGSTDRVPRWQIETVEAVAREIDAQRLPVAASWWPGYFVSSRTSIAPELANDFGFRAASVLSAEERARLHVVTLSDVGEMIRRGQPRMFVEGNWAAYPWATWLPQHGYHLRSTIENVRVWTTEAGSM